MTENILTIANIALPLQVGTSKHQSVRRLQAAFLKLGYDIGPTGLDGWFGHSTELAVKAFQAKHDMAATGTVTSATAGAIARELDALNKKESKVDTRPDDAHPGTIEMPPWLKIAISLIGTQEIPGPKDNPAILNWAKAIGGPIARDYLHDETAWCALFANYVLAATGHKGTGSLWALDFATWGQSLSGPAVGAFAPMTRKGGGHIAIVIGKDQLGNLMMVGGNQSDQVKVAAFPVTRPVAFRWPLDYPLPTVGISHLPLVKSDGTISTKEA